MTSAIYSGNYVTFQENIRVNFHQLTYHSWGFLEKLFEGAGKTM